METIDDFMTTPVIKTGEMNKLRVDLIVQSSLFSIALLGAVVEPLISFFAIYFGIGAYQLISSFAHLKYEHHSVARIMYWPQLLIHAFTFLSLTWVKDSIEILVIVLFTTGFSALYFYFLTLAEYARKNR